MTRAWGLVFHAEYYCPFCGHKGIWEDDLNDCYLGNGSFCPECQSRFQFSNSSLDEEELKEIEAEIKQKQASAEEK